MTVQVISLSERLEESEGGTTTQVRDLFSIFPVGKFSNIEIPQFLNFRSKSTANVMLSCWNCVNFSKMSIWNQKKLHICLKRNIKKLLLILTNKLKHYPRPKIGKNHQFLLDKSLFSHQRQAVENLVNILEFLNLTHSLPVKCKKKIISLMIYNPHFLYSTVEYFQIKWYWNEYF